MWAPPPRGTGVPPTGRPAPRSVPLRPQNAPPVVMGSPQPQPQPRLDQPQPPLEPPPQQQLERQQPELAQLEPPQQPAQLAPELQLQPGSHLGAPPAAPPIPPPSPAAWPPPGPLAASEEVPAKEEQPAEPAALDPQPAESAQPSIAPAEPAAPSLGDSTPAQPVVASTDPQPSPGPLLPLAPPPTPVSNIPAVQGTADPVGFSSEDGEALATIEFPLPRPPGVVLGGSRRDLEFDDGFGDDFGNARRATVLAGPLTPPEQPHRRLVRYDLLAGIALVLALLALVPLLLLRSDPDEMSSTPKLPTAGGADPAGDVTVELAQPTDLTDKVRLDWKATRDLDFAVVVAAEGESTRVLLAERNHSMTIDVKPGLKYCFLVQASDGDQVYESEPQPLRGATCHK